MIDAEKAVLYYLTQPGVLPSDFYDDRFGSLFLSPETKSLGKELLTYRRKFGVPMTQTVFLDKVERRLNLSPLDPESRMDLYNQFAGLWTEFADQPLEDADNPSFWLENLRLEHANLRLTDLLSQVIEMKRVGCVDQGIALLRQNLMSLEELVQGETVAQPKYFKAAIPEVWEKYVHKRDHPEEAVGVMTGITPIDKALKVGLMPGDMLCAAGRAGRGKSVFLNSVTLNAFKAGLNVIVVNKEMAREDAMLRLYAAGTNTPFTDIRSGNLSDNLEERILLENQFTEGLQGLYGQEGNVCFLSDSMGNLAKIRAEIAGVIERDGFVPDLIVVDYLNIMQPELNGMANQRLRGDEIIKITAEQIRQLGRDFACPTVTAAQINREGAEAKVKGKEVGTEVLSGGDYIGNTADVVLRLFKDDTDEIYKTLSVATIKMRNGGAPKPFKVQFDGDITYMYYSEMMSLDFQVDGQ